MKIGNLYMTRGINDKVADDSAFAKFILNAISKYKNQDWGDTCPEDKKLNDEAVNTENRIVAKYKYKDSPVFIITEWNKENTTILFCDEY